MVKKTIKKKPVKKSLVKRVLDKITTPTIKHEYVYKVDLSLIFRKLQSLAHPLSIQRGKLAIYQDVKGILKQFEDDKEFMDLVKAESKKK